MKLNRFALVAVLVAQSVLATAALGNDATTGPPQPVENDDLSGVWLLDLEASDPVAPMLEAMEAPWIVRKMAPMMTPTLTVTLLPHGGVRIVNDNPIQTTRQEIFVDDTFRERKDPLGRKVVSKASWNESGNLVVSQRNYVDEDRSVRITSTWKRDAGELTIINRIEKGDEPVIIRRLFRPRE